MDSNRKVICFKELLAEGSSDSNTSIVVIPCCNLNKVRNILQSQQITDPSKILLHIELNDIDNEHLEDVAYNLKTLADEYK